LYPGVYIEEVEVGAKPIEGVSTDTVGMVGVTQKGPLNKPTLITSFPEFCRKFGGYLDKSYADYRYLPHAVEGFFQNGGQEVYVTSVAVEDSGCDAGLNLVRGQDDSKVISDETIIGKNSEEPSERTGLCTLKNIDQISIIAIPNGTSQKIQNAMITHCELMKNRFAVLDPIENSDLEEIQEQRSLYDSKYAALYYPWVNIRDPYSEQVLPVPPSGHICGIYARVDAERGVHKAPAGEVVRGVLGLERKITKGQQDTLIPLGINCLRVFRDRELLVCSARTISSDALWKYVNVRRLVLFLEESIEEGTQWVVFEPNDEKLWTTVKQAATQFLTRMWRVGALMGSTPEEGFFVKCDRSTMTQDDIDNGRLILRVGVAMVKPAEFIVFRIVQWASGSGITE